MAATGSTPISLYYTATAGNTPTAANLIAGELAINTNDGKLFYKDSSGTVQILATKAVANGVLGTPTSLTLTNATGLPVAGISATGTASSSTYLRGDGSWAVVNSLPTQTGNSGKYLTTDGSAASWTTVNALPTQTGNSGKYLTTDGTTATWSTVAGGGSSSAAYTRTNTTATAGQTTFSATYTVGYVQVYLNGVLLDPTDYTATNGTTVVLGIAASAGDLITTVAMTVASVGSTAYNRTSFTATAAQTTFTATYTVGYVQVYANGVLLNAADYTATNGTSIVLATGRTAGDIVEVVTFNMTTVATSAYRTVTEFTATLNQKTFTTPTYTVGYINVYRNGVMLGTADYTATTGTTVVLANAASAGDLIAVESFLTGVVTNAIPATAGAVGSTLLAAGAVQQSNLGTNVAGNGPAFSATKSSPQTVTSGVFTTVTFDTEQFDTNNNFASNTFTPTVAGYYQINANVYASGTITRLIAQLLKNGGSYRFGVDVPLSTAAGEYRSTVSALVYMNGSTDYLNLAALAIGTAINFGSGIDNCAFNGVLVRAA